MKSFLSYFQRVNLDTPKKTEHRMSVGLQLKEALRTIICSNSRDEEEPFYLYDVEHIRTTCRKFKLIYRHSAIHFATMANPHPSFLEIVKNEGVNVFVNSLSHLKTALDVGYRSDQIAFAASAMDSKTMAAVHECNAIVNLDSPRQIAQWRAAFPDAPLGLRCNIGHLIDARSTRAGYFIGKESRLGLSPAEIAQYDGSPDVVGLHVYVGTDIVDIDYFKRCYEVLGSFAHRFPNLTYLDFGGGFGIENEQGEKFDYQAYNAMVTSVMEKINGTRTKPLKIIIEPGRIIGGCAGFFVCRVIDVKTIDNKQFVGVNASSAQFPRPLFYPETAFHPAMVIPIAGSRSIPEAQASDDFTAARPGAEHQGRTAGNRIQTSIFGCSTYSRDYLARDISLPQVNIGDLIVLGHAGSYCAAAHTSFLGFPPAKELFHDSQAG